MARRKPPLPPRLDRRPERVAPKPRILVFCEGRNTEPDYLEAFAKAAANPLAQVVCVRGGGVPLTLVQAAVEHKKRQARSRDSFDRYKAVWVIFDRDQHPNLAAAFALARQNKIDVAFSNPCFEVWALLHVADFDQVIGRHAVQARLKADLPGYDPKCGKSVPFDALQKGYDDACRRAALMRRRRADEGQSMAEPYTDVDLLTQAIARRR